jgi:hypothetical protein
LVRQAWFWLGFALFCATPGLVEAFLVGTGRLSISARISPVVQDHVGEAITVALVLGVIIGVVIWHFAHYVDSQV